MRAVAALLRCLLAALLVCPVARAEPVVALVGGPDPAARRHEVLAALAVLGHDDVTWLTPQELGRRMSVVAVVDRRGETACGGPVSREAWSGRLEEAQERLQLLDLAGALALLSALELDVACLGEVPRRGDLFLLGLVMAEAHAVAGRAADDPDRRRFHQVEVDHGLGLAATYGGDLPPPSWLSPVLAQRLVANRTRTAMEATVPVYVGGVTRGLWLDGLHVTTGLRRLAPGRHLVQATGDAGVEAAGLVEVEEGRPLLVVVTPGEPPVDLSTLVQGLLAPPPDAPPAHLSGVLELLALDGREAVLVAPGPGGLQVWGRGGGTPVLREPRQRSAPPAPTFADLGLEPAPRTRDEPLPRWSLGVGLGGGATNLGGGALEGLGGPAGGPVLQGRVALAGPWLAAVAVHPAARISTLPPGYDARWLVRAMVPVRAGVRASTPPSGLRAEAGLDGGLLYLGRFERQEVRLFLAPAVGLVVPLVGPLEARLEASGLVGTSFAGAAAALTLGIHETPPRSLP